MLKVTFCCYHNLETTRNAQLAATTYQTKKEKNYVNVSIPSSPKTDRSQLHEQLLITSSTHRDTHLCRSEAKGFRFPSIQCMRHKPILATLGQKVKVSTRQSQHRVVVLEEE